MTARLEKSTQLKVWAGVAILLGLITLAIAAANSVMRGTAAANGASQNRAGAEAWGPAVRPNNVPSWPDRVVSGPVEAPVSSPLAARPAIPALPDDSTATGRQTVNLWNTTAAQFEANLFRAVGSRLMSRRQPSGVHEYLLPTAEGQQTLLRVEPAGNQVSVEGSGRPVQGAVQLVHALDSPGSTDGVRFVATSGSREEEARRLIHAVQLDAASRVTARDDRGQLIAAAQQTPGTAAQPPAPPSSEDGAAGGAGEAGQSVAGPGRPAEGPETARLVGPVQVQVLEGLDAIIIKGRPEDVKRVQDLVQQLVEYSKVTEPVVDVVMLKHADAVAIGTLLKQLYAEVYAAREGTMSITPLAAPNAILLIGRKESIEKLTALVARLDQPIPPASRFQIFHLKHCPAEQAQKNISDFFAEESPAGAMLVPRVHVVYDFRANALIVRATPADMEEVAAILARLDNPESKSFKEVRVFKLKNASAEVLAPVLQDALTGQMYGQMSRRGQAMGVVASAMGRDFERKSTRLQMITVGADGRRTVNSGILTDAQVTADTRTNSVVVTASTDSMALIAALVHELDLPPTVEAQVKVFTLVNGDATNMVTMLKNIFSTAVTGEEIAVRTGVVPDETSLVTLHFDVDVRTNSVIATGSAGALVVVEALVTRLDGSDPRQRRNDVYRLKNYMAADVATAINQYLTNKRTIETSTEGVISESEQIAREVIVVPEAASNSLIVSATPAYFDEIMRLIEDIDQRPAMAVIQVVIAEVALDNFDEFGIELGLEDSLLFDRRVATGGLAIPGSLFSNGKETGGQAVSSLGTGQVNSELSYGGLVLSASSESVSALIRALSTCRRFKVLSRPQVMTLDNQKAQVVVGEDVPTITSTTFSELGQSNGIAYRQVGLILTVTPRITPDGYVVMEIIATNSKVGPIEEGIPVSVAEGQVIRSPRIEMINAQTVVSAIDGQTVVLGGLIVEDDDLIVRRVPVLSTIPVLGNLFKYEANSKERRELLIIMTPRIVKSTADAEQIACIEASRLHWCRCDVERLHGGYPGDRFFGPGAGAGPQVIYPDETPTADTMPGQMDNGGRFEIVPTPDAAPVAPGTMDGRPQSMPEQPTSPDGTPGTQGGIRVRRPQWRLGPSQPATPGGQPAPTAANASGPQTSHEENRATSYMIQPLPAVHQAAPMGAPTSAPATPPQAVQFAGGSVPSTPGGVSPAAFQQGN